MPDDVGIVLTPARKISATDLFIPGTALQIIEGLPERRIRSQVFKAVRSCHRRFLIGLRAVRNSCASVNRHLCCRIIAVRNTVPRFKFHCISCSECLRRKDRKKRRRTKQQRQYKTHASFQFYAHSRAPFSGSLSEDVSS